MPIFFGNVPTAKVISDEPILLVNEPTLTYKRNVVPNFENVIPKLRNLGVVTGVQERHFRCKLYPKL